MIWKLWSVLSVRKFKIFNLNNVVCYTITFLSPVFQFYENLHAFCVPESLVFLGISDIQGSELVK